MSKTDLDNKRTRQASELRIQRQIAFASGLFQGDVTVRTLLESLAEGVVIIDDSGTILLVNTAAEQMFGYPRQELIGKPQAMLIPERFRKIHEEHQAQFFAEPRSRPTDRLLDLSGRRRDGSEFPVEISLSYVETINGVLVMALVSDITLRKQFETRLRESEELFHTQVEGVKDYAIFMLDLRGNILNWNAGAERLKGYRTGEIIGTHFSCFYTEEERNAGKPEEELEKAAAEGRFEDEGWRVRKDGSRFWADVIITALYDESGNLRGFSKLTHDTTERKGAEDALRFSEARYRALFRDNPTMIVTLDAELTMLSINPACANQLGYTIDELEGESVLKIFHEDDRPAVTEQLQRCLQNPHQVNRWQFRKIRKDGGLLWVEETVQAVYDLSGALNLLVVCQDVSERKRAEAVREQLLVQLDAVLNSINEGVVIIDLEGNILTMNPSALAAHEFENVEQARGHLQKYQETFELSDMDGRPVPFAQWPLSRVLRGERFADYEVRVRRKDTGTSWIGSYSGTSVQTRSGDVILSLVTLRDITERKLAETEIQRLSTFPLMNPTPILELDANGQMTFCNPAAYKILKNTGDNPSINRLIPQDMPAILQSLQDKEADQLIREIEINGRFFEEFIYFAPQFQTVRIYAMDISERKLAEEALQESEIKFAKAFQAAPSVLVIASLADGRYKEVNEAFERVFGYQRAEVIGRSARELNVWLNLEDRAMVLRMLAEGKKVRDLEINFRSKAGAVLICLYSAEVIEIGAEHCLLSLVSDITARKKAEEALRQSEERHRRLYNETPVMLHSIDQDGRLVSVSNYWLDTLGYERSEVLGRISTEFLTAASRANATESVLPEFFRTGSSKEVPYQIVKKNGEILDILLSAIAERNREGEVVRSLAVLVDVTERNRAEEALLESENKFSKAFQATPSSLIISSVTDGRYREVNEAFVRMMGYRRDELIGRSALELNIWQNPEDRTKVLRMLAEGKKVRDLEIGLRSKLGTILVCLYSAELIEVSGEQCLLSLVSDITARKKAEEALRKSEKKFLTIFHAVPAILGITNLAEGRFIDVNATCTRVLGYQRDEVIGQTSLELGIWKSPADRNRALGVLQQHGIIRDIEIHLKGKTGESFTGLLSAEFIEIEGEQYILSMINDITERKRMEVEIARLNTDLAARATELETVNRELEAFNYSVAHDLRKPLTVVNGYCQALQILCGNQLDEDCKGYLQEAYDGTWRMNQLIDALLDLSRLAHIEPLRKTVDLSAMAHEVAAELKLTEPERRITFLIADGISVEGDGSLLRVVLDNLIGNAWKYNNTRDEGIIEFSTTEVDEQPVYFVRDNGTGFDMADADKLFIPFQRLPGAEKWGGFGIGLATVERIIRRHGGRIWAEGEPDKGATFYFTLSGDRASN